MAFNIGPFHPQAPHFIVHLSCKACQQVHSVMVLFARNHQFHWEEAHHPLSVQVRVMPAKKPRVKSADWNEDETHVLPEAWAPTFRKL